MRTGCGHIQLHSRSFFEGCRMLSIYKEVFPNLNIYQQCPFFLQHSEWTGCNHTQMGTMDAIMSLDRLVDESDPDVDFPNSFHAFQTAEGIRQAHPDKGTGRKTDTSTRTYFRQLNILYLLSWPRLVPAGGSDPWCRENHGSLGWTPGSTFDLSPNDLRVLHVTFVSNFK